MSELDDLRARAALTATLPDPYEGWSEAQLKQRCRDLCMDVDRYQHIAMAMLDPGGFDALPMAWQEELTRLRAAYDDAED